MDSVEERDEEAYNLDDIQAKIERLERALVQNAAGAASPDARNPPYPKTQHLYKQPAPHPRETESHAASLNREPPTSNPKPPSTQAQKGPKKPSLKAKPQSQPQPQTQQQPQAAQEEEQPKDSGRAERQLAPKYVERPLPVVAGEGGNEDQDDEMGALPRDIERDLNRGAGELVGAEQEDEGRQGRDWEEERRKLQEEEKLL